MVPGCCAAFKATCSQAAKADGQRAGRDGDTGNTQHLPSCQQRRNTPLLVVCEDNQILNSTKRLGKERLGRRCAYAWECGAGRKGSNGRAAGVRSWWSGHSRWLTVDGGRGTVTVCGGRGTLRRRNNTLCAQIGGGRQSGDQLGRCARPVVRRAAAAWVGRWVGGREGALRVSRRRQSMVKMGASEPQR
jgi:hypothetical protein